MVAGWRPDRRARPLQRAGRSATASGAARRAGIDEWLLAALAELARDSRDHRHRARVGHGAAAVLLDGERAVAALDYEARSAGRRRGGLRRRARSVRGDAVAAAGGRPQSRRPALLAGAAAIPSSGRARRTALLWPQYWALVLCGERASEVTSLGCHTDLWRPAERAVLGPGAEARLGGAAGAAAPRRRRAGAGAPGAGGRARPAARAASSTAACTTATPRSTPPAACRSWPAAPFAVVSTGTWFVCLRPAARVRPPTIRPRTCWPTSTSTVGRRRPRGSWAAATTRPGWARRSARLGDPSLLGEAAALGRLARRAAAVCARPAPRWSWRGARTERSAWSPRRGRS